MQHNPSDIKRLLFVDDDTSFLSLIEKVFRLWSKGMLEIVKVAKVEEVVPALECQRVHLLVIDTYTPGKDGVKFLRTLHKLFPSIPKAVLTENYSTAVRDECMDNGALRCLEKPRTMEAMERIFKVFEEMANSHTEGGFFGTVRVASLLEILQLECLNRSTSVLEFVSGRFNGKVFIENGAIVHAEAGPFSGPDALSNLIALKGGDFKLAPFSEPLERSITANWEVLLMEAAQSRDEGGANIFKAISGAQASAAAKDEPSDGLKIPAHLEEVVYAKSQLLDDVFGPFARLQILSDQAGVLADLDVANVVRRESSRRASMKTEKGTKQKLNQWALGAEESFSFALAIAVVHPDYSSLILTQYLARQALDKVCLALKETAEELQFGGIPVARLQWRFENASIFGAERPDGTLLLIFTPREILEADTLRLHALMGDFQKL